LRALKRAARTADFPEVHGLFRAAANGTDLRLLLWFTCVAALAGLLVIPLLVRRSRSPDSTFEVSSILAVFPVVLLRSASSGPRELRSSPKFLFQCPGRWFPTLSHGIRLGDARCRRHCCRSVARRSVPLRPSIDLVPGVHSRVCIAASASVLKFHLQNPVPTSPFCTVTPVFSADCPVCTGLCAVASAGFSGLLHPDADPGVRCVSFRRSGDSDTPHRPLLVDVLPGT